MNQENNERKINHIDKHLSLIKKNRKKILYSMLGGFFIGLSTGLLALWFLNWNIGIFVYSGILLGSVFGCLVFRPSILREKELQKAHKFK